jgi:hypothetical protein
MEVLPVLQPSCSLHFLGYSAFTCTSTQLICGIQDILLDLTNSFLVSSVDHLSNMYARQPWDTAPPGPPPYYAQGQAATAPGSSQAYVLTLTTLPVPSGHPLPPMPPGYPANYSQLTPLALQFNGLPIYGPMPQATLPNSLYPSVPSVAPLTIGTQSAYQPQQAQATKQPQQAQQAQLVKQPQLPQQLREPRVIFHLFNSAAVS